MRRRAGPAVAIGRARATRTRGFGLLELAVVLIIIGLLLAVGSRTVIWTNESEALDRTRQLTQEISRSLVAFARTHQRLPCPADPALADDHPLAGMEDCLRDHGAVPHRVLLLPAPALDLWHRPLVYAVYRAAPQSSDLTLLVNRFDGIDESVPVLNLQDFCAALAGADPALASTEASVSIGATTGACGAGTFLNQAFVLASAGLEDADGDSDVFDGDNADALPACFDPVLRGRSAAYDDVVVAMSFMDLLGEVCP